MSEVIGARSLSLGYRGVSFKEILGEEQEI